MPDLKTLGGVDALSSMELAKQAQSSNELKKLGNLGKNSEKEINKAATGFEALLLHEMLKSMWATVDETDLLGEKSFQGKMYRDMFNQATADSVAQGRGIGLKDYIKKELTKQYGASKGKGEIKE